MKASNMAFLSLSTLLVVALTASGQQMSSETGEKALFGVAPGGLLAAKVNVVEESSRITGEGARSRLPGGMEADIPRKTLVDEHIFGRLEREGIVSARLATDEEFIRRVYIDVTGLLPTADAVRRFVASKDGTKRDNLIDSLIGPEEFAEQWAWFDWPGSPVTVQTRSSIGTRNGCESTGLITKWSTI